MTTNNSSNGSDRKNRIIGLFNRAAPTYDQVGPSFFTPLGQKLAEFAQIQVNDRVLDVATGRGAVFFPAARFVGRGGSVVGTDLSEAMVDETRKEAYRRGLKNIRIVCMDAESLQFPAASFDVVCCGFALFFFPNLEKALSEMRRVLVPGGRLAVTTWEEYEDERWKWFDKLLETYLPPEKDTAQPPSPPPPTPDFSSVEGMHAIIKEAGFNDVECQVEKKEAVYQNEEQWWMAQWSHGGRAILEEIETKCGTDGLGRFKLEVFEGLRQVKAADGIHTMWPAIFTRGTKPIE